MCGRAKYVIAELNQRIDSLEEKLLKVEEKLSKKKKKIKLIKKQKQAQKNNLCTVIVCLIVIIVTICVGREMTSSRMKYLP